MEGQERDEVKGFPEEANRLRRAMLSVDSSVLKPEPKRVMLEEMTELSEGRMDITVKGITFECFVKLKPEKPLYVILNGSATIAPPEFKRWKWHKFIDGSMLNIADPMYRQYPDLKIGWYYGDEQVSLRHYVADIVRKAAALLGLSDRDIIFYGSSGGGTALIQCAALIGNCTAVAINPQIRLCEYSGSRNFTKTTGIRLDKEDEQHRNDLLYFLKNGKNVNYLILQNLRSADDMLQQKNIMDTLGIKTRYGLSQNENIAVWTYDAPSVAPHNAQEYYCIYFIIKYLIDCLQSRQPADEEMIRWVTEMWYERAKCKSETDLLKRTPVIPDSGAFRQVMFRDELIVPDAGNKWGFAVVFGKLAPNTRYRLSCDGSEPVSGSVQFINVGIKDKKSGRCALKQYPMGQAFEFEFIAPEISADTELCIYTGSSDKTGQSEVRLRNVRLDAVEKSAEIDK